MGRGPPGPDGRPAPAVIGRRAPGGGGIGRPEGLSGRPGGGGIGRPVALSGGRVDGAPFSPPSPDAVRCVGRIVVGPSGETVRVGAGLGTAARLRTTLVASGASGAVALDTTACSAGAVATLGASTAVLATAAPRVARTGASTSGLGAGVAGATFVVPLDFVAFAALVASSGCTSRRSPSASARRRMRSACASSIEAEGLEAPIPSFWASASNSLLVRPSSLESSCTRIFFWAKTFPCFTYSRYREHSYLFFHNCDHFELPLNANARTVATSPSPTAVRSDRATWPARSSCTHLVLRHIHTPRPIPRPRYHFPSRSRPARTSSASSRRWRQTTQVRWGAMPRPPRSPRRRRPLRGRPRRRWPPRRRRRLRHRARRSRP